MVGMKTSFAIVRNRFRNVDPLLLGKNPSNDKRSAIECGFSTTSTLNHQADIWVLIG